MNSETGKQRPVWSSALVLAVLAVACIALVELTHDLTREQIEANEQAFLEESLRPVLAGIDYDGALSDSTLIIPVPHDLPGNQPATVYRIFEDNAPLAALFVVVARDGYAGPIRLLIGITSDGRITRARVIEHRETPGLGDRIEADKSDWMNIFDGRSLQDPNEDNWKIRRDGGDFDQLSGASITSRAVVKALRETLIYLEANRDTVFAPESGTE
ncbi:MAG: electron transport complex subunit RsxG [Pseudomonadota bacterium]